MFGNFFRALKEIFIGPSIKDTFEEMVLQEAVKTETDKPTTIVLEAPKKITDLETVKVEEAPIVIATPAPTVNDQITDAVTQVKPKRTKSAKGKFVADDKSTPEVNEAWVGGKAPAKKPAAPKKPRKTKTNK